MDSFLVYDCQFLNLSTLKDQIRGKDKNHILNLLLNVEDKEEAWAVLDLHYGDIDTVLPRIRAKLNKLPDFPVSEADQVSNYQAILNYYKVAKQHQRHETSINFDFIQTYSVKLKKEHSLALISEHVRSCVPFIEKIKNYQRVAMEFTHTTRAAATTKTFQNVSMPGSGAGGSVEPGYTAAKPVFPPGGGRPPGGHKSQAGMRQPGQTDRFNNAGWGNRDNRMGGRFKKFCTICKEQHWIYKCPLRSSRAWRR